MHLFLFDVDSVLVEANGYLRALQDTVAHFSRQMGVGAHPPTEAEVRALEAHGLTSEWDSAPTCVAALLVERLRREPGFPQEPSFALPADWADALTTLAAHSFPLPHPGYADLARRVGERMANQPGAAQAARAVLWEDVLATPNLEPHRSALDALFDTLLGRTHDFYRAPITRHFQHLVIGSQGVRQTYGVDPDFESAAYLQEYDRPLLATDVRTRLRKAVEAKAVRIALYTARPSLPPADANVTADGYSPEAEMARSLVGLDDYPLIGLGRVRWLAERAGRPGRCCRARVRGLARWHRRGEARRRSIAGSRSRRHLAASRYHTRRWAKSQGDGHAQRANLSFNQRGYCDRAGSNLDYGSRLWNSTSSATANRPTTP
jgi:hypothetical protein